MLRRVPCVVLDSNAVVLAREADAQLMLEGDSSKVSDTFELCFGVFSV
jgi:hypothetical protein